MQTFRISFEYNHQKMTGDVTPVINKNKNWYDVQLPDRKFTIQPGSTEGSDLIWVDDKDENLDIYQAVGEAIERMN